MMAVLSTALKVVASLLVLDKPLSGHWQRGTRLTLRPPCGHGKANPEQLSDFVNCENCEQRNAR